MTFVLDESTAVTLQSEGVYRCSTDKRFWNGDAAYGGWLAAAVMAALQQEDDHRGMLVNQTVQFHRAVRNDAVDIRVSLLERRRTLDFWSVTCTDPVDDAVVASATMVCGEKPPSETAFNAAPEGFGPQSAGFRLEQRKQTPTWFGHFDMYLVKGIPFNPNPTPASAIWIREGDGRPVDDKAILAIVDAAMPRTFFVGEGRLPASTVTLSTHIYATAEELAKVGNDYMLLTTDSATIRHSFANQQSILYAEDGLVLATSYQTTRFRER
ncbi:MAG: thioesterase family protein [Pseudomonadota bacterium]